MKTTIEQRKVKAIELMKQLKILSIPFYSFKF